SASGEYLDPAATNRPEADAGFRVNGDIIRFQESGWDLHVPMTEFQVEGQVTTGDLQRISLAIQAAWAGYAHVNSDSGNSFFVGLASGYEHSHTAAPSFAEPVAVVHLLGPTAEILIFAPGAPEGGPRWIRIRADLFPDFAAIRTLAFEEYADSHDVSGAKSLLQSHQYYFAFGMTAKLEISGRWDQWEVGGKAQFQIYDSIEGRDREQEWVTDDFTLTDRGLTTELWLAYLLPGDRARLSLIFQNISRQSQIREVTAVGGLNRYLAEFSWTW
ncbi:MAG: hypothetical protein AAB425_13750, partial [Bdellovibrionota bacterium]